MIENKWFHFSWFMDSPTYFKGEIESAVFYPRVLSAHHCMYLAGWCTWTWVRVCEFTSYRWLRRLLYAMIKVLREYLY